MVMDCPQYRLERSEEAFPKLPLLTRLLSEMNLAVESADKSDALQSG